ncbi:hypothetical protein KDA14_02050 [Candidatus Saccharibacteria bacterium]|nr:hypothetical protein [Candidatus Saccharibacteria bacterium]
MLENYRHHHHHHHHHSPYPYTYHPPIEPLLRLAINLAFVQLLWFILQDALTLHDSYWVIGVPTYAFMAVLLFTLLPATLNVLKFASSSHPRRKIRIAPPLYRTPIVIQVLVMWLVLAAFIATMVVLIYKLDHPDAYDLWPIAVPFCVLFGVWSIADLFVFIFSPKRVHIVSLDSLRAQQQGQQQPMVPLLNTDGDDASK